MNEILNFLNLGVGLGKCVPFIKLKQQVYHNTFLILFHKPIIYVMMYLCRRGCDKLWKQNAFKYSFFQYTIIEWNKLDWNIEQPKSMLSFRNSLLKSGWPIPKPIYNTRNPTGLTLLKRLRRGPSNLNQDKLKNNFRDFVNPLRPCSLEIESPFNFFLHCHYFTGIWKTLFNELPLVKILLAKMKLWNYFSMGIENLNSNRTVVSSTRFIIKSERFNRSMIQQKSNIPQV